MIGQARAELPNECCGLLAGTLIEPGAWQRLWLWLRRWLARTGIGPIPAGLVRRGRALRRYPLVNEAASPTEYLSEPHSMFAAEKDRRAHNLEFLAVYHSHPTSEPVPSCTDRERNYSPDVMNLIISLKAAPVVRAWWLTAESYREAEWVLSEESEL
jgi:proteasome lid subunit RPN8/RPN11